MTYLNQELPEAADIPRTDISQADRLVAGRAAINAAYDNLQVVDYVGYQNNRVETKSCPESQQAKAIISQIIEMRKHDQLATIFSVQKKQGAFQSAIRILFKKETGSTQLVPYTELHQVDKESVEGGRMFGQLGDGEARRLFWVGAADHCDNVFFSVKKVLDSGAVRSTTLTYKILPNGILKVIDHQIEGQPSMAELEEAKSSGEKKFIVDDELRGFMTVLQRYQGSVAAELYGQTSRPNISSPSDQIKLAA